MKKHQKLMLWISMVTTIVCTLNISARKTTFNTHSESFFPITEINQDCSWGNSFLTPTIIFTNTDQSSVGSQIFNQVITNPESHMQQRCLDVAKILYRRSSDAPRFRELKFEIRAKDPSGNSFVAYKYGNGDAIGIAVSSEHLTKIYQDSGNNSQVIKDEIDGILFHEVTHGYNISPIAGGTYDGSSPFWAYTEGIADAVRIHSGFHQTRNPNVNDSRKWLSGYTTTGFFLHYVSQKHDKNFIYKFNKAAKDLGSSWSFDNAFNAILNKGVESVWNEYVSYINGGNKLDYDGDYPWSLDCGDGNGGGGTVDITNDGGAISDQYNDSPSGENISKLVDDNPNSKFLTFNASAWVQYQATKAYTLSSYTITSANDAPNRDPKNWTLQGSNNGNSWQNIDQKSNQDFPNRHQKRTFSVQSTTAYQYFRLTIDNNSGSILQMAELELMGTEGNSGGNQLPTPNFSTSTTSIQEGQSVSFTNTSTDATSYSWTFTGGSPSTSTQTNPVITYNQPGNYTVSLTATNSNGSKTETKSGYITVSSTGGGAIVDVTNDGGTISDQYNDSPSGENISKLVDDNPNSKFLTFNASAWIQYRATKAYTLSSYTITSANDAPNRDPKNWTLQGSNNGNSWQNIDQKSNQDFPNRHQKRTFSVQSTTAYQYFRLSMDNNSGSILQIAELELLGTEGNSGGNELPTPNFSASTTSIQEGQSVSFTNTSTDATSYSWTFNGGSPSTSTQTNPVVTYNQPGTYAVSLTATNNNGSNTETKSGYITVSSTGGGGNCDWGNNFLTPSVEFTDYDGTTIGSTAFNQVIPNAESYMKQRCLDVAKVLYRNSANAPRFRLLKFNLKNEDFVAHKFGSGDQMTIEVSTQHLGKIYRDSGNNPQVVKDEIDGILFHEVTHGYNISPIVGGTYDGSSPFWAYTEGIADAVRIHAGFHQTRNPNVNDSRKWLSGYTTTGFFLHYVSQKHDKNFIYKFNKAAKDLGTSWSFDNAFNSILNKGVQSLWDEYVSFINAGNNLDYDGDYPWSLDCGDGNGGNGDPCEGIPSYNGSQTYQNGDKVVYQGYLFELTTSGWVNLGACGGVKLNTKAPTIENQIQIYPNPVNDILNLQFSTPLDDATYRIIDLLGKTVLNGQVKNNINTNNLEKGIYVLRIKDGKNSYTKRFIKE
ncbi:basic secretory protein-like protein [Aquimarina sediminis]|uniref:basic secretory protein-like protein n=1 Tax=Aquimarina sediminis TaxID=2070536 RepID=UPI000CA0088E|nr:basic secretory protein-like protein [Aquimarina sediminis]